MSENQPRKLNAAFGLMTLVVGFSALALILNQPVLAATFTSIDTFVGAVTVTGTPPITVTNNAQTVTIACPTCRTGGAMMHWLPSDAAGITSTASCRMEGFGSVVRYTPLHSGNLTISFAGQFVQNTGGDGFIICAMTYGTGTQPNNNDVQTGTVFCPSGGNLFNWQVVPADMANDHIPDGFTCHLAGFSVGTTYWFDIAVIAVTGGTITQQNPYFSLSEAP